MLELVAGISLCEAQTDLNRTPNRVMRRDDKLRLSAKTRPQIYPGSLKRQESRTIKMSIYAIERTCIV